MKTKKNYYKEILSVLQELNKLYPSYNMGRHLSTIIEDYGDIWGISDKELLSTLVMYKSQLDMDPSNTHVEEEEIDRIIKDGMNLSAIKNEYFEEQDY